VSTEKNTGKKSRIFFLPILMAAPLCAVLSFAIVRYGPIIKKIISIAIKLVVKA